MKTSKQALIKHYQAYPDLKIRDIFKFIFQSSFGCEHLVSDEKAVTEYIQRESEGMAKCHTLTDALDGAYSRVHLSWLERGLAVKTLGRLFFLSAKTEPHGKEGLSKRLKAAEELISEGKLPFSADEFEDAVKKWQNAGFGAVHHSEEFRSLYKPAYRVISNGFVPYLSLFAELDRRLKTGRVILAIEGGCASGKTTLSGILKEVYRCNVFHADDFFLQPHQRTEERLSEVGGNLDRERLEAEVLIPLSKGDAVEYRRFDCCEMKIMPAERFERGRLTVIEGAYSMHPDLRGYYDFSVFIDIPEEIRKERITKRNEPYLVNRFFNEWIPMENRYFSEMKIKDACDFIFDKILDMNS